MRAGPMTAKRYQGLGWFVRWDRWAVAWDPPSIRDFRSFSERHGKTRSWRWWGFRVSRYSIRQEQA